MPSLPANEPQSLETLLEKSRTLLNQDAGAALSLAQEAVSLAHSTGHPHLHAKALRIRAMAQGSIGNITAAQSDFQAALSLAQQSQDFLLVSQCLHGKAVALKHQSAYSEAIANMESAVQILREIKNDQGLQNSLNALAAFHGSLSNYGEAIACLTEALELAPESSRERAHILSNIAMVYLECGQSTEAIRYFEESLAPDEATASATYRCNTLISYASALKNAGRSAEAVVAAQRAMTIALSQQNKSLEAAALVALGCSQIDKEQAELTLRAAQQFTDEIGQPEPQLTAYQALGNFLVQQNQADEGCRWLRQALSQAEAHNRLFIQSEIHQQLSRGYELQGSLSKALAHYQTFHKLYAQFHQESAQHRLQNQLAQLEVERVRRETESLRQQVLEDPLTQLYNRRYLTQFLESELARARRYELPLSVILIDIDDFKQVNDQHSHRIGDLVLLSFANLLRQSSRTSDVLVRQSGDEFVIITPETPLPDAKLLAERLRQTIAAHRWDSLVPGLTLTVSIGVADLLSNEDILDHADKRLYMAKRAGKNQVMA
ncbi:tetratricopeptide repeat-containing diguanylate cyclase [Armatimonas sp.]|uniref:tetratricopeptide repeat-containing diguanylate cyclase n=1 Tax=Armatimonas sp. TaxID=1872638 RepID=UPI00286CA2B2|nr:tetratricopeptide repeat-containing diguanylate cyclase [Armatimonas sp.]